MKNSLVCIDANIIIWTLTPFPLSEQAENLIAEMRQNQITLLAPTLLLFEVTSTLRRFVHLKHITADAGDRAFARFLQLDIRLSSRRDIFPIAWQLAKQFSRPRAYDASYLAVAQLNGCPLWTGDKKLFNSVSHQLDWVNWLGNYDPPANDENV